MEVIELKGSSSIRSIAYSRPSRQLQVTFRRSALTYVYHDVDEYVFRTLLDAPSKGKFFNTHIRPVYQHEKV